MIAVGGRTPVTPSHTTPPGITLAHLLPYPTLVAYGSHGAISLLTTEVSHMSSISSTVGSLLSTVNQGANVITGVLGSAVLGTDMLNQRVREAHASQTEKLILEAMNRTNRVVEKYAKEEVVRREELTQWLGTDKVRKSAYDEIRKEMMAKLQPTSAE